MLLTLASLALGDPLGAQGGGLALDLDLVASGIVRPVLITQAGDGSGRLFVVQQTGQILLLDGAGGVLPTPFLDLGSQVSCCGERGLLGLAFHPDYASNGRFYVDYTDADGNTVVARYSVSANDPDVSDPGSAEVLLTVAQPFANHNGGNLAFGPDGYLYIGLGDGGSGGDPGDRAQDLGTLLGKILRIDVDHTDLGLAYAVPPDNPFVGVFLAREEIWAYGLRNPWRFSFDRATGDLFIGDVGQASVEEIDFQPAASSGGENYGWRRMEGSTCFNPPTGCDDGTLTLPILEYTHDVGSSVTGGFRYRGLREPRLRGVYLFGDFSTGQVWGTVPRCDAAWQMEKLLDIGFGVSTFGEDEAGEVYLAQYSSGAGKIYRLKVAAGAGGPAVVVSPATVDFGNVEVGSSATREITLTNGNAGPEALQLASLELPVGSDVTLDVGGGGDPCGSASRCLPPGASCTVALTFTPSVPQLVDSSLGVTGNSDPAAVPMLGKGYVPCTLPLDVELTGLTLTGTDVREACTSVTAGPGVRVAAGGDVTFRTGGTIVLRNGFSVDRGARFAAVIDPLLIP